MSKPWFARKGSFRFRALTPQGRAVMAVTYTGMILCASQAIFTDPESPAWWIGGFLGLLIFVVGHAVILWKMDWNYTRR